MYLVYIPQFIFESTNKELIDEFANNYFKITFVEIVRIIDDHLYDNDDCKSLILSTARNLIIWFVRINNNAQICG